MPDASWNTYTPPPSRSLPGWLTGLAAVAAVLVVIITLLVATQQSMRRQAWPLARAVATRLATDEGALDLYRKNPALGGAYPTEQAFLATVRAFRPGLTLPDQEPRRSRDGFASGASPSRLYLRVRGEGGTWMELVVERRGPFGKEPQGEGISRLRLADSRAGLRQSPRPDSSR